MDMFRSCVISTVPVLNRHVLDDIGVVYSWLYYVLDCRLTWHIRGRICSCTQYKELRSLSKCQMAGPKQFLKDALYTKNIYLRQMSF